MSSRKSSRVSNKPAVLDEIKDIFLLFEERHGELCWEDDKAIAKIRNTLCRYIDNCGGYRVIIKSIVLEAIDFFDKQMEWFLLFPKFQEDSNPFIQVLVLAAHICQKYNVQNEPNLMQDIMIRMFEADGGFMRIMNILDPLIFPHEVDKLLYPLTNHEDVVVAASDHHLKVLEFFLREAGHVKVDITYSDWDFLASIFRPPATTYRRTVALIDAPVPACRGSSPLLLACQSLNPKAVLLLLRYGSKPAVHDYHHILGWQFQHPLYHIVMKLNVAASWKQRNHAMDDMLRRQFNSAHATQEADAGQCLVYFSRAMVRLPLCDNEARARSHDPQKECLFYMNPTHLTELPKDRWCSPAKLQHLARCRIRQILSYTCIPTAIYHLPLPKIIKSYLNLLSD